MDNGRAPPERHTFTNSNKTHKINLNKFLTIFWPPHFQWTSLSSFYLICTNFAESRTESLSKQQTLRWNESVLTDTTWTACCHTDEIELFSIKSVMQYRSFDLKLNNVSSWSDNDFWKRGWYSRRLRHQTVISFERWHQQCPTVSAPHITSQTSCAKNSCYAHCGAPQLFGIQYECNALFYFPGFCAAIVAYCIHWTSPTIHRFHIHPRQSDIRHGYFIRQCVEFK
jgi:hypothetical protein